MLATNFEENLIPKINKVLKFVRENEHSDFYIQKYGNAMPNSISNYEVFRQISLLKKDDYLAIEIKKRTFVPQQDIAYYSFSSGTTNQNRPTVIPHASLYMETFNKNYFNEDELISNGAKKVLLLLPPLAPTIKKFIISQKKRIEVIQGDPNNLKVMAQIAQEIGIDAIATTATILYFFIDELKKINFDLNSIRWISIGGEFCSTEKKGYFKKQMPNVFFNFRFGNSEIGGGGLGYQCAHLKKHDDLHQFHINSFGLVEILDENQNPVSFGETGEIVYTDIVVPKAFPLIRYRTGDMASLENIYCPCGNHFILNLSGKAGYDRLKVNGVTISTEMISRAVGAAKDYIEPRFQLHIWEKAIETGIKPLLEIHVKSHDRYDSKDLFFEEALREKISANLQLSAKSNLTSLVEQGVFLPLSIKFLVRWPSEGYKTKSIISHLS